ncbi:MAG TPA: outer membrane beta-barrel protein [Methylomirabilota bacterium]|nr:outer membrane beta-barrel protein [Methylomirabilota bacterium]
MRWLVGLGCAIALSAAVSLAGAEDGDRPRGYLHLKFRDTNNLTGVHDYFGFGLGVNLNRYLGVELSGDRFELFPEIRGIGTIGEYGVFALMPQVRLRYPLVRDRLVPYVIGGAGIALTDFNDRKTPSDTSGRPSSALGLQIHDESTTPVGTLGAGVEYFLADNIALGVEFKYLFAGDQTLTVGGTRHTFNASSPLTSFGLRLFYPELRPASLADAGERTPTRLYLAFRAGAAISTQSELVPGVEATPVPAAYGGELAQFFGASVGLDLGRYFGAEFAVDGYEVAMAVSGLGTIGEYAVYAFTPALRLRYPLAGGRVVPYGTVGVGLVHAEFNDRKPRGADLPIDASSNSAGAVVSAGIEYFVTSNIALGLESKFVYSPGHSITIGGRAEDATLQAVALAISLRAYLFAFTR